MTQGSSSYVRGQEQHVRNLAQLERNRIRTEKNARFLKRWGWFPLVDFDQVRDAQRELDAATAELEAADARLMAVLGELQRG